MGDMAEDAENAAEYLEAVEGAHGSLSMLDSPDTSNMEALKANAQNAPKGATVECPTCHTHFTKNHPRQAFCNKDGRHRCKDRYNNTVSPKRRDRSQRYMSRY